MVKLSHIYEGWSKSLGLAEVSQENKQLALDRVRKCVGDDNHKPCPFAEEMWLKKFIDGILKRDELGSGIGCTRCGCPVQEKALVINETCPEDKW